LEFSNSLTKLIGFFLSERKFRVSVEPKCWRQEKCKLGYHKVLSCPPHFLIYI
jgi:hypothetical protein